MRTMIPLLYTYLLRLYPPAFRECFADEMQYVFAQAWADAARRGPRTAIMFCLRESVGLFRSILYARFTMRQGNSMTQIIFKPRIVLPALIVGCMLLGGVLSLQYWGYLFNPPSPAPVTGPIAEINSIHLVQFDADFQAETVPVTQLPDDTIMSFPPSRILPALGDRLDSAAFDAPLDPALNDQLTATLRTQDIRFHTRLPEFSPEPQYCLPGCTECSSDSTILGEEEPHCFKMGIQLQPDGTILEIRPEIEFDNGVARATGETKSHVVTPENWWYYSYLMPAGYVVQGRDAEGEAVVLANIAAADPGGDDRYRYHAFLFDVTDNGLSIRAETRYQFDISGLEGFTFPFIALVLFVFTSLLWLAVIFVVWLLQIAGRFHSQLRGTAV